MSGSTENHWSSCGLHRGPAYRPKWCDCGGVFKKPTFWGKLKAWAHMNYWYFTGTL